MNSRRDFKLPEQNASYLEDQLHLAQAEISRMRGTISWRITGPIRAFRNIVVEPLLRLLKTGRKTERKP